jgi:hypothetical protein
MRGQVACQERFVSYLQTECVVFSVVLLCLYLWSDVNVVLLIVYMQNFIFPESGMMHLYS